MRKNKRFYKICGIAAVICLMALFSGMTALAANNVQDISFKKTVYGKGDSGIYYRIKMPVTGILKIDGSAYDDNSEPLHPLAVTIYDAKAKGKALAVVDSSIYLKKGTYLLLPTYTNNNYSFRLSYKKWDVKCRYYKKKAAAIKRSTIQKGIIEWGHLANKTNKNHWYKFTLTRSQEVTIKFKISGMDTASAVIIPGKGTGLDTTAEIPLYSGKEYTRVGKVTRTLPKGTYFIKVSRKEQPIYECANTYSISWK